MTTEQARQEIDKAESMMRQARAGIYDIAPVSLVEWEQQMQNRIKACVRALEKKGSTYVLPRDLA